MLVVPRVLEGASSESGLRAQHLQQCKFLTIVLIVDLVFYEALGPEVEGLAGLLRGVQNRDEEQTTEGQQVCEHFVRQVQPAEGYLRRSEQVG